MAKKTTAQKTKIAEALDLAAWYKTIRERTNDAFWPLLWDHHRYLVMKGGGGSGKSILAGQKILERAVSEEGHRFLVCRKVGRTIRQSCFNQLVNQIAEYYPGMRVKINRTDMVITFPNGSEILFSGLDDVEKLKSIYNITGEWLEEASELTEADFNQLDIRLRGKTKYYKQIIITFNPVSVMHWLKKRFFDTPDPDDRVRVHESTYKDNRFLDEENIRVLESFKDIDEYYYQVYCLGMWGVTGRTVFDGQAVTKRLLEDIRPNRTGEFLYDDDGLKLTNIRFETDPPLHLPRGFVKVYKDPEKGVPYVIGADTAGDGSDWFVAQVLDNRTGEQVCVMRMHSDEDLFAKQLFALGTWYNTALIAVETNLSTYPVMELERLGYRNQYVRETLDDYTHQPKRAFGFRTDSKTRPVIIAELIKAARDDINMICDTDTLTEMLTFVRNEDYRPEAEAGAHDDCIMSLAIAHHVRPFQSCLAEPEPEKPVEWSDSMKEDYRRASPAERAYMIKKWGRPK